MLEDAWKIHRLVRQSPPLDVNSCYAYLMLCRHFADTCAVAEHDDNLVGFVSAYRPPSAPRTLFVWQVAVDGSLRGQGLAGTMLDALLDRDVCRDVEFVETTIGPSNIASQKLFLRLAERHSAACEQPEILRSRLLGEGEHEDEVLFRIGPLRSQHQNTS